MALLFVGGVMNVLWLACMATVLLEKLLPAARWITMVIGAALICTGVWLLISPMLGVGSAG